MEPAAAINGGEKNGGGNERGRIYLSLMKLTQTNRCVPFFFFIKGPNLGLLVYETRCYNRCTQELHAAVGIPINGPTLRKQRGILEMAKSDSKAGGDSGKQRPQVQSAPDGPKPPADSDANRGDTVPRNSTGPTELPAQFGRYRVKKKLGFGGMGTVYLVENIDLKREEALKVPHFTEGEAADPKLHKHFLREAQSAANLEHPNLCPVYHAGVHDGIYFITMRLLKGKPLTDYTGEALPPRKAVEIVAKLAKALQAATTKKE